MGGRGAYSTSYLMGQKDIEFQKNALGFLNHESLKEAIGAKGAPIGILDAYKNANPAFSEKFREYSENCQRCVVAYELRRRGYDVHAQATYEGDKWPLRVPGMFSSRWQGAFRGGKLENVSADTRGQAWGNLSSKVASWGAGARGIVRVTWENGGGHVFNVENVNGKVKFFDAQTGNAVSGNLLRVYKNSSDPSNLGVMRVDNLRVSERAKNFVTVR